jgi:hypothetical protein
MMIAVQTFLKHLRAAKKRKILKYDGELLLQGVHDNVEITLLPPPAVAAA